MAPAAGRLRPPSKSSGNCSPGGRLLALRMRGGQRPLAPKQVNAPRGTVQTRPAAVTCCGRMPIAARPLLSAKIALPQRVGSLAVPPAREDCPEALHGEEKAECPPPPSMGAATYSGGRRLAAPLGTAARGPSPAPPLPTHSLPRLKGPGASPAAGEGGILGGSVRPPSKRGQVFLPSPCWG